MYVGENNDYGMMKKNMIDSSLKLVGYFANAE